MMRFLLTRTLYEKRWFLAGWSTAFAVMSALVVMFFPSFSDGGGFDEVAKSLPSQLQGLIGDPAVFRTIDGYIALQVFDIRMSLLIIIMTLVLAMSLTIKDEEAGDLRTTLATSLSRTRVAAEKGLAALVIICILNGVSILGVYVGLAAIGETAPHGLIWQLGALSCLLATAAFSIPFGIGIATGKRSVTLSIGIVVALGSYIITTFARTVDGLKNWDYVSLVHYYDTAGLRNHDFHMLNLWVFATITIVSIGLGIAFFRSRDIA
jgi:ABC-type transport system involved in multi-copper enzyme maturation permease subunit